MADTDRERLTPDRIKNLTCEPGKSQQFKWDTDAKGLAVRVTPAGSKSFIFQGKMKKTGVSIRMTIGDVRGWLLDNADPDNPGARQEARRLQTLIDQDIDPRQHRAERIAAAEVKRAAERRKVATVGEAWGNYIAYQKGKMARQNIERKKKWGARHLLDHERMTQPAGVPHKKGKGVSVAGPLVPLMGLKLSDIDVDVLKGWQRKEAERRANVARQAFEAFRAFWRWCARQDQYKDVIDSDVVEDTDLRDEVPGRKAKKDDCLQIEQLPAWFAAVRRIGNTTIAAYLQTLLLTGARREELLDLTWDKVDFQWKTLTIHDKVSGERTIPLTPYVASLLAALPRRKDAQGNALPWVFSSPTAANGRLQEPGIQHRKACAAAGVDVSLHGLRRSFATISEWTEAPTGAVAQIMGHHPSATAERHYKQRGVDLLRLWHAVIEGKILSKAGIEQPEEGATGLRVVAGGES